MLLDFPEEIVEEIIYRCRKTDRENLRLVSASFAHLCASVIRWVIPSREVWEHLIAHYRHSLRYLNFSRLDREIDISSENPVRLVFTSRYPTPIRLLQHCTSLTSLDVRGITFREEPFLGLTGLTRLNCSKCSFPSGSRPFRTLINLVQLVCAESKSCDLNVSLPALTYLNCTATHTKGSDLRNFPRLLTLICSRGADRFGPGIVDSLPPLQPLMPNLTVLSCAGAQLQRGALQGLTALKELSIEGCELSGALPLSPLPSLRALSYTQERGADYFPFAHPLADCPMLTDLRACADAPSNDVLSQLRALRTVSMCDGGGQRAVQASALPPTLTSLSCRQLRFSDDAASAAVAASLQRLVVVDPIVHLQLLHPMPALEFLSVRDIPLQLYLAPNLKRLLGLPPRDTRGRVRADTLMQLEELRLQPGEVDCVINLLECLPEQVRRGLRLVFPQMYDFSITAEQRVRIQRLVPSWTPSER